MGKIVAAGGFYRLFHSGAGMKAAPSTRLWAGRIINQVLRILNAFLIMSSNCHGMVNKTLRFAQARISEAYKKPAAL